MVWWMLTLGNASMLLLGLTVVSQATEVVRLTNGEWPPFTSKTLKHYGVYSHIVSEAFALENLKVEYGFFPWPRGYIYVKRGKWDGSVTWAPTPQKKSEVLFSDPVTQHIKVFFHLKSFPFDWSSIDDLTGLPIGVTAQYTYGDVFDRAMNSGVIKTQHVVKDIFNLRKLIGGRIQIFPSDIDVGYYILNKEFSLEDIARVTHHPKPIQTTGTCVIFTKANPEKSQRLLKLFNQGLSKLKKSGAYDQMFEASRRGDYLQK